MLQGAAANFPEDDQPGLALEAAILPRMVLQKILNRQVLDSAGVQGPQGVYYLGGIFGVEEEAFPRPRTCIFSHAFLSSFF